MGKKKKFKKTLVLLLVTACVFYLFILLVGSDLLINNFMFHPPRPSTYKDSNELIKLEVAEGVKISAKYFPVENSEYILLYSHGNAVDIGKRRVLKDLGKYKEKGFSVFTYDYEGYGCSDGSPSEGKVFRDAEAAYRYVTEELKIPPEKIIISGHSLGSGPATYLAEKYPVAALILNSPFLNVHQVVTGVPILPYEKFANEKRIANINCPLLISHGDLDIVVPFWHGKALYEKAAEPKLNFWLKGADHNEVIITGGDRYWAKVNELLKLIESGRGKDKALASY